MPDHFLHGSLRQIEADKVDSSPLWGTGLIKPIVLIGAKPPKVDVRWVNVARPLANRLVTSNPPK